VKRGGKTALWVYGAGVINPGRAKRFSTEHITGLTGIRAGMVKGPVPPACRLTTEAGAAFEGLNTDREYGRFDRQMAGTVANIQPPGMAWSTLLYPCFYADDPEANVIARFTENGLPALAMRDFGTWRSIHAYFKAVRSDILRAAARSAGCHIYAESDDILYAGRHFVTLHASESGRKTIRFPGPCDPFEIYERASYGTGVTSIDMYLDTGDTKTFYLHGEI
jgi:hypothetical protein